VPQSKFSKTIHTVMCDANLLSSESPRMTTSDRGFTIFSIIILLKMYKNAFSNVKFLS